MISTRAAASRWEDTPQLSLEDYIRDRGISAIPAGQPRHHPQRRPIEAPPPDEQEDAILRARQRALRPTDDALHELDLHIARRRAERRAREQQEACNACRTQ